MGGHPQPGMEGPLNGGMGGPLQSGGMEGPLQPGGMEGRLPVEKQGGPQIQEPKLKDLTVSFMQFLSNAMSWDYRNRDIDFCCTMIPILVVLVVACVGLNGVVLAFYRGKKDVVSLVYTMLSGADILVGVGSIFTTLTLIFYLSFDLEHKDPDTTYTSFTASCYLSFIITSISIRVSVFINAMLAVIRTIMIRNPFSQPNKKLAIGFTVATILVWLIFATTDCITAEDYSIAASWSKSYSNTTETGTRKQYLYMWYFIFTPQSGYYSIKDFLVGLVSWSPFNPNDMLDYENYIETGTPYAIFTVTFIAPTLIAVGCMLAQMAYLRKGQIDGVKNKNTEVTVTIMMLTAVFVLCNMAMIIYTSSTVVHPGLTQADLNLQTKGMTVEAIMTRMVHFYRGMFTMSQVVPLINSVLSPAILILRGSALKGFFRNSILKSGTSRKSNPSVRSVASKQQLRS